MSGPGALAQYFASEYHRRNMQVARVAGAQAAVDQALDRARTVKSIPGWLIAYLESAAKRLPGLSTDLAAWRDLAPDAPDHVGRAEVERLRAEVAWHDRARAQSYFRRRMAAPEDAAVFALCEQYGYGAVIDAACRLWARKDPRGAFYVGGCLGLSSDDDAHALFNSAIIALAEWENRHE